MFRNNKEKVIKNKITDECPGVDGDIIQHDSHKSVQYSQTAFAFVDSYLQKYLI